MICFSYGYLSVNSINACELYGGSAWDVEHSTVLVRCPVPGSLKCSRYSRLICILYVCLKGDNSSLSKAAEIFSWKVTTGI